MLTVLLQVHFNNCDTNAKKVKRMKRRLAAGRDWNWDLRITRPMPLPIQLRWRSFPRLLIGYCVYTNVGVLVSAFGSHDGECGTLFLFARWCRVGRQHLTSGQLPNKPSHTTWKCGSTVRARSMFSPKHELKESAAFYVVSDADALCATGDTAAYLVEVSRFCLFPFHCGLCVENIVLVYRYRRK